RGQLAPEIGEHCEDRLHDDAEDVVPGGPCEEPVKIDILLEGVHVGGELLPGPPQVVPEMLDVRFIRIGEDQVEKRDLDGPQGRCVIFQRDFVEFEGVQEEGGELAVHRILDDWSALYARLDREEARPLEDAESFSHGLASYLEQVGKGVLGRQFLSWLEHAVEDELFDPVRHLFEGPLALYRLDK